jgi:uncharacterized protein
VLQIPYQQLSPEALTGLIEEFITREGTEYGPTEVSRESKIAQVLRQLERGSAVILFDSDNSSCNIVDKASLAELQHRSNLTDQH